MLTKISLVGLSLVLCLILPPAPRPDWREILQTSWQAYKARFIQADGRVIDWRGGQITTSEGQSYAMLRAVWIDDRETFDRAFKWANHNLRAEDHALYAWKWGQRPEGSWGKLNPSPASDADQDIAHALALAARRWNAPEYEKEARRILADLWKMCVVETSAGPVLTAGDWAAQQANPVINPSYFAPYAYRLFATLDPERPWAKMVDSSYILLDAAASLSPAGLIPDWCVIERKTGRVLPAPVDAFPDGAGHGYDAWRAAWRISLDAHLAPSTDPRPLHYLRQHRFMLDYYIRQGRVPDALRADGTLRQDTENIAVFGTYLPAFALLDTRAATRLFEQQVLGGFERMGRTGVWGDPRDYYGQNWMWLGLALYADSATISRLSK